MELTESNQPVEVPPEEKEMQKLNQEFQQKCFEGGRIRYNIESLNSKIAELEKMLEVTERAAKNAGNKLNELSTKINLPKVEPKEEKKSH